MYFSLKSVDAITVHSTFRHGGQLAPVLVAQHPIMLDLEEVWLPLYYGRHDWIDVAKRPLLVAPFVAVVERTASDATCSWHDGVVPPAAPTPHSHSTLG